MQNIEQVKHMPQGFTINIIGKIGKGCRKDLP